MNESVANELSLQEQFRKPTGWIGRIVGWIMSYQNRALYHAAIDCLDVNASDDILEIGCGPGEAIRFLTQTPVRSIIGIDPSTEMLEQAASLNRDAITSQRVHLVQGHVELLPFENNRFSKAFAVSTFHDWKDRIKGLVEVRRVLRNGGRLVLCLRRAARWQFPWTSPGLTQEEILEDQAMIEQQGFRNVRCVSRRLHYRIVCLVACA